MKFMKILSPEQRQVVQNYLLEPSTKELIINNKWEEFFENFTSYDRAYYMPWMVNCALLDAEVDFLSYMSYVPVSCFPLDGKETKNFTIKIPSNIKEFRAYSFYGCPNLTLLYDGTVEEYEKIVKSPNWDYLSKGRVICSNGTRDIRGAGA